MKLRRATMHDANFLLELKNDSVMRSFAVITNKKIQKSDHMKWLPDHLHEISIVMEGKNRIGMFRVGDDREVSINLHPKFRGKGYGTKILKKYCPKGVWAKIVDGNIASLNIFVKNGFTFTGYENNYYLLRNDP